MATSYPTIQLQPGSTDVASVKQLQDYLVSKGYMTQAQVNTGYGTYGPQTTAAVLAMQKSLGVDYSTGPGYFGPRTLAALGGQNQPAPASAPTPTPVVPATQNVPTPDQTTQTYIYQNKSYAFGTGPYASQYPKVETPKLPPSESSLTVGKQYIQSRLDRGMAADEQSVMNDYNNSGLRTTYGDWRGSSAQYNAMIQFEKIQAGVQKVSQEVNKMTGNPPAPATPVENPPVTDTGLGTPSTGGEVNSTYQYAQMSGADYQKVMDNIVSQIGTTDLTKLISDFSGGTISTPELEVNKEQRDQALKDLKDKAAAGLKTLQQGLAAKGMTFSGIRTEAEAAQAADTLSQTAGINSDFALKIINAARNEQSRRETALKVAETNYNKALADAGYVYNPFTNTIEQTLESKRYALDLAKALQPKEQNYPTSYDEWQLAGGLEGTGKTYNQWLQKPKETFTEKDFWATIDKGKTDLQQGESWGNVWNRVKQQFPNVSDDIIDNTLGISWKEEGAYQKWAASKKTTQEKIKFTMPDGTVVEI